MVPSIPGHTILGTDRKVEVESEFMTGISNYEMTLFNIIVLSGGSIRVRV